MYVYSVLQYQSAKKREPLSLFHYHLVCKFIDLGIGFVDINFPEFQCRNKCGYRNTVFYYCILSNLDKEITASVGKRHGRGMHVHATNFYYFSVLVQNNDYYVIRIKGIKSKPFDKKYCHNFLYSLL